MVQVFECEGVEIGGKTLDRKKGKRDMKAIKIDKANEAKIDALMADVKGRANEHTHRDAAAIIAIAESAEKEVVALVGSKKNAVGATVSDVSGSAVANAYNRKARFRVATAATLYRSASGWFLTALYKTEIGQHGGTRLITLTEAQDALAVASCRARYRVKHTA
jgi:hypothetical protein